MSLNIVTGYTGIKHVTSAQDGALNAGIVGTGKYVLNIGSKFAYELTSNNLIKIRDGQAINQGRQMCIDVDDYEELTIENGLQSVKRNDLVLIHYTKNTEKGVENAELVVMKGVSGDTAVDPAYETGNIIAGDTEDYMPLYRIKINGLNVEKVEPLFDVMVSMKELNTNLLKQRVVTLAAGIVIAANQDSDVYRLSSVCDIPYSKITNVTPFVGYTSGGQRVIVTPMRSGSDYFVRAWNTNTSSVTLTISATVTYKE